MTGGRVSPGPGQYWAVLGPPPAPSCAPGRLPCAWGPRHAAPPLTWWRPSRVSRGGAVCRAGRGGAGGGGAMGGEGGPGGGEGSTSSSDTRQAPAKRPAHAWAQCDRCNQWRRLPQALADALDPDAPWSGLAVWMLPAPPLPRRPPGAPGARPFWGAPDRVVR